jgi:hypothetical protein
MGYNLAIRLKTVQVTKNTNRMKLEFLVLITNSTLYPTF